MTGVWTTLPVTSSDSRVHGSRLRWLTRLAWGASGFGCVVWFAYEDRGLTAVVLLSAGLCLAAGLSAWAWLQGPLAVRLGRTSAGALAGLVAGAAVGPGAALLILIKTGLHAHPLPDFTAADLNAALSIWPAWTGAGLAAGWGLGWLAQLQAERTPDNSIVPPTPRL